MDHRTNHDKSSPNSHSHKYLYEFANHLASGFLGYIDNMTSNSLQITVWRFHMSFSGDFCFHATVVAEFEDTVKLENEDNPGWAETWSL